MTTSLELLTPRLRLRPLAVADAEAMAALMTPGISRWTASLPGTLSRDEAAERLGAIVRAMQAGDDVTLAIELRDAPGFIGWIGLRRLAETPERAALGYWIGEAFHGQGYTREAAQAFLPAAWAWLDVAVVEAAAQLGNDASLAILRGLGMTQMGERLSYSSARGANETCLWFETRRPA